MKFPSPESVVRALRKKMRYCLSFLKKDWTLRDYPIRLRRQSDALADPESRFKLYPWSAQIDGWGVISGTGNSAEEASARLAVRLGEERARRASRGEPLPRPGTDVPIQFASTAGVKAHDTLLQDFIHRVLQLEWAFISDESTLWHFHTGDSNDAYVARIHQIYGVDVSDIADATIADILDRIVTHQQAQRQ